MRTSSIPVIFFLLFTCSVGAQIDETFSDGDLIEGPAWIGDEALFVVVDEEGDHKLRSNSAGAATYWLSTPNSLASDCYWEIEIDLRLNTSGSNFVEVHLIADQADPIASQNAWFVRIGGTQDRVELFKKSGGLTSSVLSSPDGIVNSTTSNHLKLRVERSAEYSWSLLYDDGMTGSFGSVGPVVDPEVVVSSFFSILIKQNSTASMVNNHYFDNILVEPVPIDTVPPAVVSATVIAPDQIEVQFTENVSAESVADPANYTLDNGLGQPIDVIVQAPQAVTLTFAQELASGLVYSLSISEVEDLSGNTMVALVPVMLAEMAAPGDLVINELLYDPIGSGADLLEIYNRSGKVIELAGSKVGNGSGSVITIAQQWPILPGGYVFLTPDTANIFTVYPRSRREFALQSILPSFVNTAGSVLLWNASNELLDRFDYHDDLHFDLIASPEGYSLERVDPERPGNDPTNWQTASDLAGRATPGYVNSQFAATPAARGSLTIDPPIFSPDNDGYQDLLTITYAFDRDGLAGTMIIFDLAGREVRTMFASQMLGTSGSISWDGLADDGGKCTIGPYIVMLEAFDLDGNVERFKRTVTLAHFLDR